jgi:heme exporter protein D
MMDWIDAHPVRALVAFVALYTVVPLVAVLCYNRARLLRGMWRDMQRNARTRKVFRQRHYWN